MANSKVPVISDPLAPVLRLLDLLPKGRSLPEHVWVRRHAGLLLLLWLHVFGLTLLGVVRGYGVFHTAVDTAILGFFAIVGSHPRGSRKLRSVMVALGLLTSSALMVHLTGGLIESHFHFFIVVPLLTLYSDWSVFLLAIAYVAVHHGVFGQLQPTAVFNHGAAWREPWRWALLHAAYVLGASIAALVAWRATEERALRDSLTQLPNAESFLEQAHKARARAMRRRERFAILFLDLDGFKKVNDTLGHAAGDQLLIGVADRLRVVLRDADTPARLGGDEFAILLDNVAAVTAAELVAARLVNALKEPFTIRGRSVSVSASVGIATSDPKAGRKVDDLLKEADEAMYAAKGRGSGHISARPDASPALA
jgi:diguanylate cyclase (GGDEF)-like protein